MGKIITHASKIWNDNINGCQSLHHIVAKAQEEAIRETIKLIKDNSNLDKAFLKQCKKILLKDMKEHE